MIPALRRRHKIIWVLMAILLPVGFLLAYKALPIDVVQEQKFEPIEASVGDMVSTWRDHSVQLTLRQGKHHERQIELEIMQPLGQPIHKLVVKGHNFGDVYVQETLGSVGTYRWSWEDSVEVAYQIQIIDVVHRKEMVKQVLKVKY